LLGLSGDKLDSKAKHVISLVIDLTCMAISFEITKIRKLSEVEMLLLMKTCFIKT